MIYRPFLPSLIHIYNFKFSVAINNNNISSRKNKCKCKVDKFIHEIHNLITSQKIYLNQMILLQTYTKYTTQQQATVYKNLKNFLRESQNMTLIKRKERKKKKTLTSQLNILWKNKLKKICTNKRTVTRGPMLTCRAMFRAECVNISAD